MGRIAEARNWETVASVSLEIGAVSLSHDDLPEHVDDISLENLEFALRSLSRGSRLEKAEWKIKKTPGDEWKIVEMAA